MQILSPPLIGYLRYYTKIWWYQFYVHMYRSVVASFRLITLLLTSVFCPPTTLWATWTIPHSINHWNQFEISILLYFRLWISPIHVTLFFTSISTYSNILNFLQKEKENFKTTKRIVLFKDSDIIVKGFRWEMKSNANMKKEGYFAWSTVFEISFQLMNLGWRHRFKIMKHLNDLYKAKIFMSW